MKIRAFTEEDIPAAAALEQSCFPDPWSPKGLRDTFREDRACFFAAEQDGKLSGYLNATWVLDECNLNRICVAPEYRRAGTGKALLNALKDFCLSRQITAIYLEVRESNGAAQALYHAGGFEEIGKRPRFYTNPSETAVLMKYAAE